MNWSMDPSMTGIRVEVGTDAVPQVDRFANINDRPFRVLHDVHARLGREGGKDALDLFRNFHESILHHVLPWDLGRAGLA